MPKLLLNLQIFADEGGMTVTGDSVNPTAETSADSGVATTEADQQVAPVEDGESFDSLIKGRYKKEYDAAIKGVIDKRFRNQRDLQSQIDAIDPIIQAIAQKYGVAPGENGSIPIEALRDKVLNDNSLYEQEAYDRGMSVEDLKHLKNLERENSQLRMASQRSAEQQEWDKIVAQAEQLKEIYPDMDFDAELNNPQFGRLLATMQRSGFPNPVQTAYEAVHREEIMAGAMRYAVQTTQQKLSNSIRSGANRPTENGLTGGTPGTPTGIDPSKLTRQQIEEIKMRASRGERITF